MKEEILKALFAWCIENYMPVFQVHWMGEDVHQLYFVWELPELSVWFEPEKALLNVTFYYDEWDYECNCMARCDSGYSILIESPEHLERALAGAFPIQ